MFSSETEQGKRKKKMRVSLVLLICFSLSLCFVSGDNHVGNVEILFSKGNNKNFGMGVSPKPLKIQGESKKEVRDDDSPGPCKEEKFSVTETAFDTPIQTFLWSPYETNHVWVITEERGFFFIFLLFFFYFFFIFFSFFFIFFHFFFFIFFHFFSFFSFLFFFSALFMSKDGGGDGWERILTEVDYIFEGTKGEVLYAINRTRFPFFSFLFLLFLLFLSFLFLFLKTFCSPLFPSLDLMSTEDFLSWNHIELPFHLNSFEVHPTGSFFLYFFFYYHYFFFFFFF